MLVEHGNDDDGWYRVVLRLVQTVARCDASSSQGRVSEDGLDRCRLCKNKPAACKYTCPLTCPTFAAALVPCLNPPTHTHTSINNVYLVNNKTWQDQV